MGAFSRLTGTQPATPQGAHEARNGTGLARGDDAPLASEVGWRVQQIVDNAMRAAAEIRDAAEADAAEHCAEAQVRAEREIEERRREFAESVRSLAARTERVRQELDGLNAALDEAVRRARPSLTSAPEMPPAPHAAPAAQSVDRRAVLFATQMAVAGSGRVAIERALRNDFGIEEPTALVDSVLS